MTYDATYYKGAQFGNEGNFTYEDNEANSRFNFNMVKQYLASIGRPFNSVFDIGASGGFFMRYALLQGVEAFGTEYSQWAVQNNCLGHTNSYRLTNEPIEKYVEARERYSCLTSWFVLEHIPVPQLIEMLNQATALSDFLFFRVPLLNSYESKAERAEYDPDPTHVNVWGFDEWRKFLWDNTDWYLINAHYSDFGVEGGPGPVGSFFCTSKESLYDGVKGKSLIYELFPTGQKGTSQYLVDPKPSVSE